MNWWIICWDFDLIRYVNWDSVDLQIFNTVSLSWADWIAAAAAPPPAARHECIYYSWSSIRSLVEFALHWSLMSDDGSTGSVVWVARSTSSSREEGAWMSCCEEGAAAEQKTWSRAEMRDIILRTIQISRDTGLWTMDIWQRTHFSAGSIGQTDFFSRATWNQINLHNVFWKIFIDKLDVLSLVKAAENHWAIGYYRNG